MLPYLFDKSFEGIASLATPSEPTMQLPKRINKTCVICFAIIRFTMKFAKGARTFEKVVSRAVLGSGISIQIV